MEDGVCPNCGALDILVDETGWCARCTTIADDTVNICSTCGALFSKKAQVSQCWTCRKEGWLTRHADKIERKLAQGLSLTAAVQQVRDGLRPVCNCCGNPIRGGKEGTRFCRKTPECRAQAEAYTALKAKGLSPDVALAIATDRVAVFDSK